MATASISPGPNQPVSPAPRTRTRPRDAVLQIAPLAALFYATLLPPEFRIEVVDQVLYGHRLVILALLPWLTWQIVRGRYPYHPLDLLVFLGSGWMVVSFGMYYGDAAGVISGVALAFDVVPPYLVARLCMRNLHDLRLLLIVLVPGIFVAAIVLPIESITGQRFVREYSSRWLGALPQYEGGVDIGEARVINTETRLGLGRASGFFTHPILAGVFLASMLPLFLSAGLRGWPSFLGKASGFLSVFTLSSAALLSLLITFILIGFDRLQRFIHYINWRLFLILSSLVLLAVHYGSDQGVLNVVIRYTLNPQTGRFRERIWEYGTRSVANYPYFGIGFESYERPSFMVGSVDNHWLMLAIRHGLVTAICFFAVFAISVVLLGIRASRQKRESERRLYVGLATSMFIIVLIGFTVAFHSVASWIFLMLGLSLSLALRSPSVRAAPAAPAPPALPEGRRPAT